MIRSTASKVMWVGRATVFLVGLSVIVAVMLGVATTAAAHSGSAGLFHLNHNNPVTTTLTKLTGTLSGAVLKLDNNGTGPALSLEAGTNRAPLTVNAAAGTATGLSADKLDGNNSTDFASAYKRTVVVSPVGTNAQNGTALLNALSGITDASATKPYLLKVEPGVYDLGSSGSLAMKDHVDIEGSGELTTLITSGASSDGCFIGTVAGADHAELRFLTVANTGGTGNCNIAIYIEAASPRLTHVTVESTAVVEEPNVGVFISNSQESPPILMSDLTVTASGPDPNNVGVWATNGPGGGSAIIERSRISSSMEDENGIQDTHAVNGNNLMVANTQIVGTTSGVRCFNTYDELFQAFSCW